MGNPTLENDKIEHQLQLTGSKVVVCSKDYLNKYKSLKTDIKALIVLDADSGDDLSLQQILETTSEVFEPTDEMMQVDIEDPAIILWTSGSTGSPKGIVHTQKILLELDLVDCPASKKALVSTSLYHAGGFAFPIYLGLKKQKSIGFITEFEPKDFLGQIARFKAEFVICSSYVYIGIGNETNSKQDFPFMKKILPLGGAFKDETHDRVLSVLGKHVAIELVYGSSETYLITLSTGDARREFGLSGNLLPGCQLYIADIESGEKLGPNMLGKIMIKTPTLLKSYLKNPEADHEFFHNDGFGYLGDIGYYTEQGDIYYSYRCKEILRVSSDWFSPVDIEYLIESQAQVKEAVVWGDYDHDSGNDKVYLAVVLNDDVGIPLTKSDIKKLVEEKLIKEMQITGEIYFVKNIPHGALMKKLRTKMKNYVNNLD